jgi:hypothetical protein
MFDEVRRQEHRFVQAPVLRNVLPSCQVPEVHRRPVPYRKMYNFEIAVVSYNSVHNDMVCLCVVYCMYLYIYTKCSVSCLYVCLLSTMHSFSFHRIYTKFSMGACMYLGYVSTLIRRDFLMRAAVVRQTRTLVTGDNR